MTPIRSTEVFDPSPMKIVSDAAGVRLAVAGVRATGRTIGFVPTMGALHDGHAALMERARSRNDFVVVSIFVNPLQFNDPRDLANYPVTQSEDLRLCEKVGVDMIYRPSVQDIYPDGFDTRIEPGALSEVLEGHHRPGHFSGMATVVMKLFNIVEPDDAYFGKKDFQQLAIIRRMAVDFNLTLRVHGVETVRESDGLAMSSRNAKLSPEGREAAVSLSAALFKVREWITEGGDPAAIIPSLVTELSRESLIELDYFEVVDSADLRAPRTNSSNLVALIAARVDGIRLIDNIEIMLGDN